jgi:hypothetical protein
MPVTHDPAVDGYFERMPGARKLFDALLDVCASSGDGRCTVQSSGIALGSPRAFGYAWLPIRAVAGRPAVYLVLTLRLRRRIDSPRFVEIVEPYPGRCVHHTILSRPGQLDAELAGWIREAVALSKAR